MKAFVLSDQKLEVADYVSEDVSTRRVFPSLLDMNTNYRISPSIGESWVTAIMLLA